MNNSPLTRRRGFLCWCCAGLAGLGTTVGARAQSPGITRTVLGRQEFPGSDFVTLQVQVDLDPSFLVARHTHPGVETTTFISGGAVLAVKGQPDRTLKPGDSFQIPLETPHALQNGTAPARLVAVYVVDKNKPLSTPAPA